MRRLIVSLQFLDESFSSHLLFGFRSPVFFVRSFTLVSLDKTFNHPVIYHEVVHLPGGWDHGQFFHCILSWEFHEGQSVTIYVRSSGQLQENLAPTFNFVATKVSVCAKRCVLDPRNLQTVIPHPKSGCPFAFQLVTAQKSNHTPNAREPNGMVGVYSRFDNMYPVSPSNPFDLEPREHRKCNRFAIHSPSESILCIRHNSIANGAMCIKEPA